MSGFGKIDEVISVGKEHITFGYKLLDAIPRDLQQRCGKIASYALITDSNLYTLFGDRLRSSFAKQQINLLIKVIEPGEHSKSRKTKEEVEDWLISKQCNRDTCIIAFGGGVVGDLSGYVASTYMRGVPFVQIPTTLLAMVDSSIGGKTGVDTEAAKNLIGSFYHPKAIYIDLSFLETLPKREFCNGMAEIIKTAEIVERTARIKAEVVSMDDKENGIRCILNYGHTIGHAIESLTFPEMLHGECVAIGMILEAQLAYRAKYLRTGASIGRLVRCIQSYCLPIHLPGFLKADELLQKMTLDKKNAGKKVRCVMIRSIGEVVPEAIPVEEESLKAVLLPYISVIPTQLNGSITVPGSKSLSNRILPICGMGEGTVRIKGLLLADDTRVMLDSLQQLGIQFAWEDEGQTLIVHGKGQLKGDTRCMLETPTKPLYLGNAGTASRFLTSMCTMLPAGEKVVLTGTKRLQERPISDLTKALLDNGCNIKFLQQEGCFPMEITGTGLRGGTIRLSANVSSQFVSSILLSAPYAKEAVTLCVEDDPVSKPFIDMTVSVMRQFGIAVEEKDNTYFIPLGTYKNPTEYYVESDASSASYPLAMAAITGGEVTVQNIGSTSLQGDSKFYTVLQMMGCTTSQTETSTTVKGCSVLKAVTVDMSDMTDTFMTVCALAAVAVGTTRITNIANQRVKECNRIAAMVEELGKCGVSARELEDGIEIEGCENPHGAEIECYNDHRIAMSFAVLGLRVPGIILKDKDCVDKTYPEFWMHLESHFGVQLRAHTPKAVEAPNYSQRPIILIGMRASGKSLLGASLATKLGYSFVDMDEYFQTQLGSIKEFVAKEGWPAFRNEEHQFIVKVLREASPNTVVATGGGIIETEESRKFLEKYEGAVIQLHRAIEDVEKELLADQTRASLGESVESLWKRRKPLYERCGKFEFFIRKGETDWTATEEDLFFFAKSILRGPVPLPKQEEDTFFLSLTFKDLKGVPAPNIVQMVEDVHAVELRVDLLESVEPEFIKEQLAILRRSTKLPVIYTVRTREQGGNLELSEGQYFQLLQIGVRSNCDFIDLEARWNLAARRKFVEHKNLCRIIVSHHDYKNPVEEHSLKLVLAGLYADDRVDVLKYVGFAKDVEDNMVLRRVVNAANLKHPAIAICAGEKGKLSRVFNRYMTPVTHPLLPSKAAPGQLSAKEIMAIQTSLGMERTQPHLLYLYGSPISKSRSPLLHNTGFAYHNLPFQYGLKDTLSLYEVVRSLKEVSTLGGSVTIPHKEAIIPFMDQLSVAAENIGAVNTVTKVGGKLVGDNTDWMGIYRLLKRRITQGQTALVVGAGGTARAACFALSQLGMQFYVWNRSGDRAQQLAARFGGKAVSTLEELQHVDIVVSTVPPTANFLLPSSLIHEKMVLVESVYQPRETPLLRQMREAGCKIAEGIELLFEQGVAQFEIFTGKKAPRKLIIEKFLQSNEGELMTPNPPSFVEEE